MWNARARAAARCWATSSSRRARTKPSTFRIRTRPTRPCFIDVLIERLARLPFSQSPNPRPARRAIFAPPVFRSTRSRNRMYNRAHSTAFEPVRSAMTYESMLAETVAFRGHKGDVGEAYYARPLGGGPWPGVVLIHHMPGWDEWIKEATRKLAHHGLATIAPHLYFREGPGSPDDVGARVRAAGGSTSARPAGPVMPAASASTGDPPQAPDARRPHRRRAAGAARGGGGGGGRAGAGVGGRGRVGGVSGGSLLHSPAPVAEAEA